MQKIKDHHKNYIKELKFCFLLPNGEIWNPFSGWNNLVEGEILSVSKLLRQVFFLHLKFFTKNKIIVIHDSWSSGYFHWVADVLPKLYLLRNELDSWEIILPKKLLPFQEESLELFNLKNVKRLESWQVGICTKLQLLKFPWKSGIFDNDLYNSTSRWLIEETIKLKNKSGNGNRYDYIFVSRQNAYSRRISNYFELLPVLSKYKFNITDLSEMGFFDQIIFFSKSKIIAGAHGAGLVNMIFMPTGSVVIEFRNSYPDGNNCYERLAKKLNHKYFPIVSEASNYNGDFQAEDILVPIEKLKETLEFQI